ncbi:hypothetical protein [Streptomyces prasinus]|uniref:Tryptophan 2,3-dioxygenase n=1 Tax=Streptomyces prasinus TaxID=67345 RepID=A0ABX6AT43_9ACTN|nr:hypothetical protein [Streptomyces prasinus]QEV04996.1 hypothetical protein CP972_04245 [Streptomyces prasinus]
MGGFSTCARQADPDSAEERALTAFRQWRRHAVALTPPQLTDFPFQALVGHYRGAGRLSVADAVVAELRQLNHSLAGGEVESGSLASRSLLAHWLPLSIDQEDGDYHTYIGTALYERHWGRASRGRAETESRDAVIVALAADLLAIEADALTHTASRHQYARTRAAFQLLQQSANLAPTMHQFVADAASGAPTVADRGDDMALATISMDLAKDVLAWTSDAPRQLVDITMLPVTQLHDEQMFIRCIQIFESLYAQVARSLERAIAALENDDAGEAEEVLRDAVTRAEAMPILFRVLTTMPRDAFAVIRDNTHGRSAIQSRSYREVELLSAPREAGSGPQEAAQRDVADRTLQEVYLERAERRMTDARADGLAEVMRQLDRAWRMSKRTHWGVTLKVIGSVPGTGGTSGADYLKHSAGISLFPSLEADEAPADASQ